MSLIIGISGKSRHGKNYLADELHYLIRGSAIYSLANALKCYCRVSGLMKVKDGKVLQVVGTDVFRHVDYDFWVRMLNYQIEEEKPKVAIICDVRFTNEVNWIESTGGICVRIERLNEDGSLYLTTDRPTTHPSEIDLDLHQFKYKVQAKSGDLEHIQWSAKWLVEELCLI